MSVYYSNSKSNWFKVNDESKFKYLLSNLSVFSECDNRLFHHSFKCEDGLYAHKLLCYGDLCGKYNEDTEDYEDIEKVFYKPLQSLLPTESDIFVMKYVGTEKLRCLDAGYVIVTKKDILYRNIDRLINYDVEELTGKSDIEVDFDASFNANIETIVPEGGY